MAATMQVAVQASAPPIGTKTSLASAFFGNSVRKHEVSSCNCIRSKARIVCEEKQVDLEEKQTDKDRWKGLATDISDDQQDITRGKGLVDTLFQGPQGGGTQVPIMSSLEYINTAQRTYNLDNIKDGYYIAPEFMDKLVIHIAKNLMDLPNLKVPLILGIWGGKGQGKSFQCELVFSKLGINPIVMSAGELESGNAGEPAKLIRQRYREAADIIKKKGQMCVLFINDLDAGAGRMGSTTQYTVNNQMVNATLMNIADNPTNVQLPGIYKKEEIPRVPVIVTGNDFSTLYAPLIRDGRMEKFYWAPTREDRIGVCKGIFRADNVPDEDIVKLVDTFPGQSIDFFSAIRAQVYDDEVRKWICETGVDNMGSKLVNSREGPPTFEKPRMTMKKLLEYGNMLVKEQDNVRKIRLSGKYLKEAALGDENADAKTPYYGKAAQQVKVPVPEGCTDPNAQNFDPTARSDDGTCEYDFSQDTAKADAVKQDNLYGKAAQQVNLPVPEGCTDPNAKNFDPTARSDDGTCEYEFSEPTKMDAVKSDINVKPETNDFYGKAAQQVKLPVPEGCADPNAVNYDPTARSDDGSCTYDFEEKTSVVGKETKETKSKGTKPEEKKEIKGSFPEKVLKATLALILLPFSKSPQAEDDRYTVTQKVYFDVQVDGEECGRIVVGLYGEDVPIGARRFGEIAVGQKGVSYRKREFYKITKKYIQNAGLRTFSLSGRVKDTARFTGGLTAEELVKEMKNLDEVGKRPTNTKWSVSLVTIDASKPPAKPKLIARDGKFEVVYEESRPDPNGTEFCIAYEDAPELDQTNLVVGRVVQGFNVVQMIASTRVVKDNTSNPYFQTAKLIGDTRAVVAERGFNRPYAKIIISKCGTVDDL